MADANQTSYAGFVFSRRNEIYVSDGKKLWFFDQRPDNVFAFCEHSCTLIDAGIYGVCETMHYPQRSQGGIPLPFFIRKNERLVEINTIVSHDNLLYSGGDEGIFKEGIESQKIRDRTKVKALVSFQGKLYDAGRSGVFETLDDVEIGKPSMGLIAHNGHLYHAEAEDTYDICTSFIYRTLDGKLMGQRGDVVTAFAPHNGRLYDASGLERGRGEIYDTLADKLIAKRDADTWCMASFQGRLLDGGDYDGIHATNIETGQEEVLFPTINRGIFAMLAINEELLKLFLKMSKEV